MTEDQIRLFRVFTDQVERALETSAQLLDRADSGELMAADATRGSNSLRELAAQARWVRKQLPPGEPLLM